MSCISNISPYNDVSSVISGDGKMKSDIVDFGHEGEDNNTKCKE
jgi:hypothetical protein